MWTVPARLCAIVWLGLAIACSNTTPTAPNPAADANDAKPSSASSVEVATSLDAEHAPTLAKAKASGYYWAPYLGGAQEAEGDLSWRSDLELIPGLRAIGKLSPGWWVDEHPTTATGQAAVAAAQTLGYAKGDWIFLDGEGIFQASAGLAVGTDWASAVHAAGFKAGAYGQVPRGVGTGPFDGLFAGGKPPVVTDCSTPPRLPADLVGWQYGSPGNSTVAGTMVDCSVISTAIHGGS